MTKSIKKAASMSNNVRQPLIPDFYYSRCSFSSLQIVHVYLCLNTIITPGGMQIKTQNTVCRRLQTVFSYHNYSVLVQLCSCRDPVVHDQEVEHLFAVVVVDCADEHAA